MLLQTGGKLLLVSFANKGGGMYLNCNFICINLMGEQPRTLETKCRAIPISINNDS